MKRKDYVKQCITSATFLVAGCKSKEQSYCIFSRANDMLNDVWKVEYKSYTHYKDLQTKAFWDTIQTELECEGLVYSCIARWEKNGNVEIQVQPNRSVMWCIFKLKI